MQGAIEKQELKMSSFRRVAIKALYEPDAFNLPFNEWLAGLKIFLDETLPLRKLGSVGHFRGYAGIKYKINYEYNDLGKVMVTIAFVSSASSALYKKETIILFIEGTKKHHVDTEEQRGK
jgi:hypothetical protein